MMASQAVRATSFVGDFRFSAAVFSLGFVKPLLVFVALPVACRSIEARRSKQENRST